MAKEQEALKTVIGAITFGIHEKINDFKRSEEIAENVYDSLKSEVGRSDKLNKSLSIVFSNLYDFDYRPGSYSVQVKIYAGYSFDESSCLVEMGVKSNLNGDKLPLSIFQLAPC